MNKKQKKRRLKRIHKSMKYHFYSKWTGMGVLDKVSKKHNLELVSEQELKEYFNNKKRR